MRDSDHAACRFHRKRQPDHRQESAVFRLRFLSLIFVSPEKDDRGSLFKGAAEKGVGSAVEIEVPTITIEPVRA